MASTRTIARVEALVWILIYGGLLTLVLGLAVRTDAPVLACVLMVAGLVVAVAGAVLIWVRSRMRLDP
ncbi:MAG: hypothetical protein IPK34_17460 [Ramlibacter sp.]|jgi:hypothetical protein|nr:hypothetical protein [Ramlibacter sp.]